MSPGSTPLTNPTILSEQARTNEGTTTASEAVATPLASRSIRVRRRLQYVLRYAPVVIVGIIGTLYSALLFSDFATDTSAITNVAFGAAAALSAICFSAVPTVDEESDRRDFHRSADMFLHAALLVLVAGLIKYAYQDIAAIRWLIERPTLSKTLEWSSRLFVPGFFLNAVLSAHDGLVHLNRVLWRRWDKWPGDPIV